MYYEFGPNEALSVHRQSMSYVVQLCDGYRLFALNDDTNFKPEGERGSGFSDDCMQWILEQLKDAQAHDQYVIAMTHHPMIAPSPFYAIIGKGDMQRNHETTREIFADAGLNCMLTGHTHIHDISVVTSKAGNVFYDIACGAVIGCPPAMRDITFDPAHEEIRVETHLLTDVPGLDTNGKPFDEYMKGFFFGNIAEMLNAAATDIDRFSKMTDAFSVPGEKVKKFGWIIKPAAKFLNWLTVGRMWKLCKKESGVKKEEIVNIKDRKVVDFILELIQNLYCGDSPYTPDTPEYRITCGVLNILDSFLNTIHLNIGKFLKGADSVRGLVEPLLYNPGPCDANAVLKMDPAPDENNHSRPDTVRPSKKGPLVLGLLILAVLLVAVVVLGVLGLIIWGVVALIQAAITAQIAGLCI